jgi:carbamoyltransferase
VSELALGKIIDWFQGRFEIGPRASGNRSILADPRKASMKDKLNARIKRREPFRLFAPAVVVERAADFFEIGTRPVHDDGACKRAIGQWSRGLCPWQ